MRAADAQAAMRALPPGTLDQISLGRTMLILAPHADDESLGCGGLIAEACAQGTPPAVLIITNGVGSHPNSPAYPPPRLRALREQEAQEAVNALGLPPGRLGFLRLPDTAAPVSGPAFDAAVADILAQAAQFDAGVLLAPWRHDPHCDHEATHLMAQQAARQSGLRHVAYPVWGWTLPPDTELSGPAPSGLRLEIGRHLAAKRLAIAAHRSQYAGLIDDDPTGFQLPAGLLAVFDSPYETFLDAP